MIRKAVGAIVFQDNEYLLVHKLKISSLPGTESHIKGEWDFPKGGVEANDIDFEAAILRELKEETGSTQYKIIEQLKNKICFQFNEELRKKIGFEKQETTMFLVEYVGDRSDLIPKDSEIGKVEFLHAEVVLKRLAHHDTRELYYLFLKKRGNDRHEP